MTRFKRLDGYQASLPKKPVPLSVEQRDFLYRRTTPFLNRVEDYSIGHLLQEAYLQGLRDAVDVMGCQHDHDA